jgi:hypothetical protein
MAAAEMVEVVAEQAMEEAIVAEVEGSMAVEAALEVGSTG